MFVIPTIDIPQIPQLTGSRFDKRVQRMMGLTGGVLPMDPSLIGQLLLHVGADYTEPTRSSRGWIDYQLRPGVKLHPKIEGWTVDLPRRAKNARQRVHVLAPAGTTEYAIRFHTARLLDVEIRRVHRGLIFDPLHSERYRKANRQTLPKRRSRLIRGLTT